MRSLGAICCLAFLLSTPFTASAQWYSDSLTHSPVAVAKFDQNHPQITSDGAGGAIITWQDKRSSYNWDIYVQRISSSGKRLWGNAGIAICTDYGNQNAPLICSDNAGGAYIVWEDLRDDDLDIYAQHIDADGDISYEPNGIPVGKAIREQRHPALISNGAGRAILAWEDMRAAMGIIRPDIYLNILTPSGARYEEGGFEAVQSTAGQRNPTLIADDYGGALLAWENDYQVPVSVWVSLIDSNGTLKWNPGGSLPGISVFKGGYHLNNASNISLARDGSRFLVAWQVTGNSESIGEDIYANRISGTGVLEWQSGLEVTGDWPGHQANPRIFSDDSNGLIVFFEDFTSDNSPKFYNRDIAAVRVLPGGFVRIPDYESGFFHIVKQTRAQRYFQIEKDEERFMLAWDDGRNGNNDTSIYVQAVDRNFNRYFPKYQTSSSWGKVIANRADASHEHVAMIKRDGGGFIMVWADNRSGDQDIYTQILFRDGTLPIELTSFHVRSLGEEVLLDWSTANERDNAGFVIERRVVGHTSEATDFEQIGSYESNIILRGAGTSSNRRYYGYTDHPTPGRYEYRLIDVSLDGTQTTHPSKIVNTGSDVASKIIFYPNPVTEGKITIESNGLEVWRIEIRDMLGKLVRSVQSLDGPIDVQGLRPGVYAISLYNDTHLITTERITIL